MEIIENQIIPGLSLVEDCITDEYHKQLIEYIDSGTWDTTLSRRVQHFGFKYNYKTRDVSEKAESFPEWANELVAFLLDKNLIDSKPNQLIINEYKTGQGINKHTDSKAFGSTIFSISLGSICKMIFRNKTMFKTVTVKPRVFMKMEGDARYKWTHEIPAITLGRRISLTFRYVKSD